MGIYDKNNNVIPNHSISMVANNNVAGGGAMYIY
jgi:hypothetical protein